MALFAAQGFAVLGPALMGLAALKGLGLATTLTNVATSMGLIGPAGATASLGLAPLLPILAGLAIGLAAVYVMNELGVFKWVEQAGADFGGFISGAGAGFSSWLQDLPDAVSNIDNFTQMVWDTFGINIGSLETFIGSLLDPIDDLLGFGWIYEDGSTNIQKFLSDVGKFFRGGAEDIDQSTAKIDTAISNNLGNASKSTNVETSKMTQTAKTWSVDFTGVFSSVGSTLKKWGEVDIKQNLFNAGVILGNGVGAAYLAIKHFPDTLKGWATSAGEAVSTLPGAFNKMNQGIGAALISLPGKVKGFIDGAAKAITSLPETIANLPETIGGIISDTSDAISDLPKTFDDVLISIGDMDFGSAAEGAIGGLTSVFEGAIGIIGPAAETLYGYMQSFFSGILAGLPEEMRNDLTGVFTDITTAFSALGGSVQTAFSTLFSGIGDYIVGLAQGFISAGYNIIMFIVQGMQSAAGAVGSMIGNIFGIIGQYIPHSPAETGPLSVLPNFAGYFVDPLLAITPQVQAASLQVAAAVTMPSAQPAAIGGGGTTSSTSIDNGLSVGTINAKEQSISDIMAELAITQEAQRKQKGYRSLPG
jgi:hypothetical protein